jgi:hypothetical protein
LGALDEHALRLWGDPATRSDMIAEIIALELDPSRVWPGEQRAKGAVAEVDEAVVAGLRALSLLRGPVREVRLESIGRGWLGRKEPECILRFDELVLRALPVQERADRVFKTWVHESIHARALPVVGAAAERRDLRGYEEGLAEGLARLIVHDKAGIPSLEAAYTYYVDAYRTLATALGIEVEWLWHELWTYAPGEVRGGFPEMLGRCLDPSSSAAVRLRLMARADTVFQTGRLRDVPAPDILLRGWMEILQRGT